MKAYAHIWRTWLLRALCAWSIIGTACDSVTVTNPVTPRTTTSSTQAPAEAERVEPMKPPTEPILFGDIEDRATPAVLLLHGYNSNHEDLRGLAALAARNDLSAISVPAPIQNAPDRFQWVRRDPETTHTYLQAILARYRPDSTERVWLAGFSQGGLHATRLVAGYPDHYHGALAISPAGWSDITDADVVASDQPRIVTVVRGEAEPARYARKTDRVIEVMRRHGLLNEVIAHEGGHHFPPRWREQFGRIFARWAKIRPNASP